MKGGNYMISKSVWKKIFFGIVGSIFFFIIVAGVAIYSFASTIEVPTSSSAKEQGNIAVITPSAPMDKTGNRINILLLGVDDGDPGNLESPRRSDTMIVASVNSTDRTVELLSIPRDTRVNIPGRPGYNKITEAYFYGGSDLAVRTVSEFLQIPINNYVVIDWQAFIKIVDILGGVDLKIEHDMNYEDPYENLSIHLHKGDQHLDGKKAGEYVRFRHDELGDIGRVQRQQYFLETLTNQLLQAGTILKIPSLITTITHYVKTDLNSYTLLKVANILKDIKADSLHTDMVLGDFATINNSSYWLPDMAAMQKIIDSMQAQM
jgi:LCP family protein required for cell wall assembly